MGETVFDKIIRKEIPADIVFEDNDVIAFRDIAPQAPVHVLVVPKRFYAGVDSLADPAGSRADADEAADADESVYLGRFLRCIASVARRLGLADDGYRVVMNHGRHGCQSVDYIHAHIIGGRQLAWPPG